MIELLNSLIHNPPAIITAIFVAIVAAHVIHVVLKFISQKTQQNSLIITLEIIVVIVISYIALELYLKKPSEKHSSIEPFLMVVLLVVFTLLSSFVYILFKAATREKDE